MDSGKIAQSRQIWIDEVSLCFQLARLDRSIDVTISLSLQSKFCLMCCCLIGHEPKVLPIDDSQRLSFAQMLALKAAPMLALRPVLHTFRCRDFIEARGLFPARRRVVRKNEDRLRKRSAACCAVRKANHQIIDHTYLSHPSGIRTDVV